MIRWRLGCLLSERIFARRKLSERDRSPGRSSHGERGVRACSQSQSRCAPRRRALRAGCGSRHWAICSDSHSTRGCERESRMDS